MTMTKNGVIRGMSNEEYHGGEGISKSDLDLIHRSPLHWKNHEPEDSDALRIGTAFHMAVLETAEFMRSYDKLKPGMKRTTKDGKARVEEIRAAGKIDLSHEEWEMIMGMRNSVLANPIARSLVAHSEHEVSIFGTVNNVLCKCRPDIWDGKRLIIADLKSTTDASPEAFAKSVAAFRYHVQDAWYRHVMEAATGTVPKLFVFIAVEKKPPYAVAMYSLDEEAKRQGWFEALADLQTYKTLLKITTITDTAQLLKRYPYPVGQEKILINTLEE